MKFSKLNILIFSNCSEIISENNTGRLLFKFQPLNSKDTTNTFHAIGLFLCPLKNQKATGFLMFSEGTERYQGHEMG